MNLTQKAINKNTSITEAKEIAEKLRIIYKNLASEHGKKVQEFYSSGDFSNALIENSISVTYDCLHIEFLNMSLCKRRSQQLIDSIKIEVEELKAEGIQIP